MEQNVGSTDRYARIAIGIILAAIGIGALAGQIGALGTVGGIVALLVGAIMLGTGLTQRCLIYQPFGINTGKHN